MAVNYQRSTGRPQNYKFDRGNMPTEFGPYVGLVVNNVDGTRSGRVQVYIEEFGAVDNKGNPILNDQSLWRTVGLISPFFGSTPKSSSANTGAGNYPGNQQSYGMWFSAPDIGTKVLCFFLQGDPSQGYYFGNLIEPGKNQMVPASGAVDKFETQNPSQKSYFGGATRLPVTEINNNSEEISENPRFFDQTKPVHSYQAAMLFQQGLINDPERGTINSSGQRESPSTVYGISTPGIPIYQGGYTPQDIKSKLESGSVTPEDAEIIGRTGGHSLVLDDGDLDGTNNLVRIRSSKGHQITMSDSGNFFYITHANGQAWIELGAEGTIDFYSTNSVNIRTAGDMNFHADRDINMYAGQNFNVKSAQDLNLGSGGSYKLASEGSATIWATGSLGIASLGSLKLQSVSGSWQSATSLTLTTLAGVIKLNSGFAFPVLPPKLYSKVLLDDTVFSNSTGWQVVPKKLESIVTRAPTHEPYPYHNKGTDAKTSLATGGAPTPPPTAEPVLKGVKIVAVTDDPSAVPRSTGSTLPKATPPATPPVP